MSDAENEVSLRRQVRCRACGLFILTGEERTRLIDHLNIDRWWHSDCLRWKQEADSD